MVFSEEYIIQLMHAVRVKSSVSKEEITDLAEACIKDLEIAGVYVTDAEDPLCRQAVKLYCKAHYGYDDDSEKFGEAYTALKDAMALSGDYSGEDSTNG